MSSSQVSRAVRGQVARFVGVGGRVIDCGRESSESEAAALSRLLRGVGSEVGGECRTQYMRRRMSLMVAMDFWSARCSADMGLRFGLW